MHKYLVKEATEQDLREFADGALSMIEHTNEGLYDELELFLYKKIHGCHFTDWLLDKAVSKMQNEDGSSGPHWTVEQTTSVAKQNNIMFSNFNEYDWNYVMNMMYSDYYGAIPNETSYYVKLSRKFLEDKDADTGKALRYYLAMK